MVHLVRGILHKMSDRKFQKAAELFLTAYLRLSEVSEPHPFSGMSGGPASS